MKEKREIEKFTKRLPPDLFKGKTNIEIDFLSEKEVEEMSS